MSNGPVFILGCTKSGTSLLRNLFDGHKDFFVIPAESHFFQNIGFWVNYYTRRSPPRKLSFDEMKKELLRWVDYSNSRHNLVADGFTAGKWNIKAFKETLLSKDVYTLKDLSDLYVASIYASFYEQPLSPQLRFVEKSVENTEFASEWLRLYPNAKFIHILRNPYSNIVAFRNFLHPKKFPFLKSAVYSMFSSYYALYRNQFLIDKNQYKVILYEELLERPEETMKELSTFLEIEYSNILLTPSFFGEPWSGNSTTGVQFSGISNKNIEKWKKEITQFEISVVNEFFVHVLKDFGFESLKSRNSIMRIAKKEGIMNYVQNRLLYFYMPRFDKNRRVMRHPIPY